MKKKSDADTAMAVLHACWSLDLHREDWTNAGLYLKGFSIKSPDETDGEWLAVVRAVTSDGDVIAFVSSGDFDRLLLRLVGGLSNGSLKWKADDYQRGGGSGR